MVEYNISILLKNFNLLCWIEMALHVSENNNEDTSVIADKVFST